MTAFTYSQWLSHFATILQVSDPDGVTALTGLAPYFIERAERLIYSDPELDFLATRETDTSQVTTRGSRSVPIPSSLITVEGVSIITPANTMPDAAGATRIPLKRTTRQFIDFAWPVETQTQAPNPLLGGYFAIFDMEEAAPAPGEDDPSPLPSSFLIMPTPDDAYRIEATGTFRPAALSATNTTTFLTSYYYPLFLAATAVIGFAYQRDFGASSDDPRAALSWQAEYQMQKTQVVAESRRQKSMMGGFLPVAMPMTGRVAAAIGPPNAPPPMPAAPAPAGP
jgi:hypothetical protein